MSGLGHNNPPSSIDFSHETGEALGVWLKEHPVVQTEDEARAGKLLIDRAKGSLAELESERDKLVRPLNEQVADINRQFRIPRETLTRIRDILLERLDAYVKAEEEKREKEAEAARQAAEHAENIAREAERLEREARDDTAGGVEADVAGATLEADRAYSRFETASREAARAEKATHVKVSGGFGRALAPRTTEVLTVSDWKAAIEEMGVTEKITEAILSSARDFRKAFDELPHGITSTKERSL